jgi:membrane fusion protein (multidrug efflux system)
VAAACGDDKKPAAGPPPPAKVAVATVERRDVPLYIEAVGAFDGYVNADIRARVRGYLETQAYKDGSTVKAGQTLFTIEATEYQATGKSAQAALSRAKVALSRNKIDLGRDQGLLKAGLASQQDVDNATTAVADAEAQVSAAEAQVQQAQLSLDYTRIKSPITGTAGVALVRVGNLVGQDGPTLLTTVSQLDPIRVNFPLSEVDYVRYPDRFAHLETRDLAWARTALAQLDAQAASGKPDDASIGGVEIMLADGSTYKHRGVVVSVNRQIDANTGTTQLQALVANPDNVLRPGEYARVRIRRENEGKNVVIIPEKAMIAVQGTYSVAIVGAGNKITLRRLELGPASEGNRVVTKGLEGGETIVVDGLQRVGEGSIVDPHPAPPPQAAAGTGATAASTKEH